MIAEFIRANGLAAELIQLPRPEETLLRAFSTKNVSLNNAARCTLYITEDSLPAIVVSPARARLDEEKITLLLGAKLAMKAVPHEVEEITGYPEEFLPPIAIYGVRVLVDLAFKEKEFIYCAAGDNRHILKLPIADLESASEDLFWGDVKK